MAHRASPRFDVRSLYPAGRRRPLSAHHGQLWVRTQRLPAGSIHVGACRKAVDGLTGSQYHPKVQRFLARKKGFVAGARCGARNPPSDSKVAGGAGPDGAGRLQAIENGVQNFCERVSPVVVEGQRQPIAKTDTRAQNRTRVSPAESPNAWHVLRGGRRRAAGTAHEIPL
jgi:hypothetical protein